MMNLAAPLVFFVDDDPEARTVVARILQGANGKVDCFEDPEMRLVALRSRRCDLPITDLKISENGRCI